MAKTHTLRSINLLPPAPQASSAVQHYHSAMIILGCSLFITLALGLFFKLDAVRIDLTDQGKQDELATSKRALGQHQALLQQGAIIADRKSTIEQLRTGVVSYDKILTTIEQATPSRLQITKLSHKADEGITIAGIAGQQSDVSNFVEQLKGSTDLFTDVLLKQTTGTDKGVEFVLLAQLIATQKRK